MQFYTCLKKKEKKYFVILFVLAVSVYFQLHCDLTQRSFQTSTNSTIQPQLHSIIGDDDMRAHSIFFHIKHNRNRTFHR